MTDADIDVLRRVVESSPVIVLLCMIAIIALWRRLDRKDDALMTLHRETLAAMTAMTAAVDELKRAIGTRNHR